MLQNPKINTIPNFTRVTADELRYSNYALDDRIAEFTTTKAGGSLSLITRGPANTGFWITWGDGSPRQWVQHLGTGTNVTTTHAYGATAGTKEITLSGALGLITYFSCVDGTLGGTTSVFSVFKNLKLLNTPSSLITGAISVYAVLPLTALYIAGPGGVKLTGNVGTLAALTLSALNIGTQPGITGDMRSVVALSSLTALYASSSGVSEYTSGTIGAYLKTIQVHNLGWTTAEVDNFLIDLDTAGAINGTVNIAGTNQARSAASDAAKATLLANGWTVTVNE